MRLQIIIIIVILHKQKQLLLVSWHYVQEQYIYNKTTHFIKMLCNIIDTKHPITDLLGQNFLLQYAEK